MSNIPLASFDGRSFAAAQSFLFGAKTWWTRRLYPALYSDWQNRVAERAEEPTTAAEAEETLMQDDRYVWFAWLERHLQRMKYSGRYGLQPWHELQRADIEAAYDPADLPEGILNLDPDLNIPSAYTDIDIHQHPGGIWQDSIAGIVYERGARTTTPLAGKQHQDLHDRLVMWIERHGGLPEAMVDLGCGFGKSTRPFYQAWRETRVVGVDIAAPCLTVAAHDAASAQACNARFIQARAEATGLPDQSADLVTSTMLLHEMPPSAIKATFHESRRLLKPGGRMVHLDFWLLPDPLCRAVHYGHARRNNEPWMEPWAEADPVAMMEAVGFTNIRIQAFEEADGTLDDGYDAWRFPWTILAADAA